MCLAWCTDVTDTYKTNLVVADKRDVYLVPSDMSLVTVCGTRCTSLLSVTDTYRTNLVVADTRDVHLVSCVMSLASVTCVI